MKKEKGTAHPNKQKRKHEQIKNQQMIKDKLQ